MAKSLYYIIDQMDASFKIAVGSKNPVKIEAVRQAFKSVWQDKAWEVVGVEVDSEVSDQPMSHLQSIQGARNRATKALAQLNADYGVGLEGGLEEIGDKWFECGWIVVVAKNGTEGIGSTIRIEVPDKAVKMIKGGMEMGQVDDILFKKENSKQAMGFFGLMTNNTITRTSGYRDGIICALARFIQSEVFNQH